MRQPRTIAYLFLLPVIGSLAACGGAPQQVPASLPAPPTETPAPVAEQAAPAAPAAPQPTPGIAARERLQLAINLLQDGNAAQAGAELKAYLAEIPNSRPAAYLLSQVETPIDMLFPAENFTVQLNRDETLSSLAGIYLGDVLGFYGLARYNSIENPSRVSVGQMIRIPSTPAALTARETRLNAPAAQASAAPAPAPAAPAAASPPQAQQAAGDPWMVIRQNVEAGRFQVAIDQAETSRLTPDRMQAVLLASAYDRNARATQASNAQAAAAQAFRAGQLYLETADRPEDAMGSLELAVMLNPGDTRAQTMLATAKARVIDTYYRNGVAAFQRQDLDGAIAAWDRVLAIDPDHRNAQVNRLQAMELKQNLQRLQ